VKRKTPTLLAAMAVTLILGSGAALAATTVSTTVPGYADPWLAGMPDGSTASFDGSSYDTAPAQSPTEATGLDLSAGGVLTFAVSGSVNFVPADIRPPVDPPDGNSTVDFSHHNDYPVLAPENGISDVNAPQNSLVGVFLGPGRPDTSPAPNALDFGSAQSRDYTTLSPSLKQVFFIGDGRTSTGEGQKIIIPNGATRLFLGPMDGVEWSNNSGSFSVQVDLSGAQTPPQCTISGDASSNTLSGTSGDDVICGGRGGDTIKGLGGNDILRGEAGADKLYGGEGDDALDGGTGNDLANYSESLTAVSVSLDTNIAFGEGSDTLASMENLVGSSKNDALTGSGANNIMKGGAGTDAIDGLDGADTLTGAAGNDTMHGGLGKDSVIGKGGADNLFGDEDDDTVNSQDGVSGNDSLDGGPHVNGDTAITDPTEKSVVDFP
jgi:hypothetical protein